MNCSLKTYVRKSNNLFVGRPNTSISGGPTWLGKLVQKKDLGHPIHIIKNTKVQNAILLYDSRSAKT